MSSPAPDSPHARAAAFADLSHALRNPLMIIRGRTHLLQRTIRNDASLSGAQATRLLRDLAAIDAAVVTLVAELDARSPDPPAPAR